MSETKEKTETREVIVPSRSKHRGVHRVTVELAWRCPECGGPRGEVESVRSYDGSRCMIVDGWQNPCGHVDKYSDVRAEALENGLN